MAAEDLRPKLRRVAGLVEEPLTSLDRSRGRRRPEDEGDAATRRSRAPRSDLLPGARSREPLVGLGAQAAAREVMRLASRRHARARPRSSSSSSNAAIACWAAWKTSSSRDVGLGEQAQEASLHQRMRGQPTVAGHRRGLYRLGQDSIRPAQVGHALNTRTFGTSSTRNGSSGGEARRARDEVDARRRVAARETRGAPRRRAARPGGDRAPDRLRRPAQLGR